MSKRKSDLQQAPKGGVAVKETCRHVEPPVLSPREAREDFERRINELQIRHWCPVCDRKIFSQFYMAWALEHITY